ncbi:helix-turn-helix transcriptional regulator [Kitasatospora griseola]|uniref:helix-turn-helix transcriptional regulator n=1 Tax=Kitasatospora griseola TaxID=2064 RepID=UPI00166FD752|nr:helix-turn-helix transcriptional regulator [Kitasatospora griseola]GGQ88072.1 helix-turn-helix transcriptional regulator [Kitasatospora griseola]
MGLRGPQRATARAAIEGLRELTAPGLTNSQIFRRADELLRPVLEFDAVCWHTSDPATGLVNSVQSDDLNLGQFQDAVYLEVWADDLATFPKIRNSGVHAETLSRASRGAPQQSIRFREQISRYGFGDELRAVFDAAGGMWGCAAFMRAADRGPYPAKQRELADSAAKLLGQALRASHIPSAAPGPADPAPAVFLLDRHNRPRALSGPAEELLARLADPSPTSLRVPTAIAMAAEHARRAAHGLPTPHVPVRIRTHDGHWYLLHAATLRDTLPADPAADEVTVVASPASPAQVIPLHLAAYGLTGREQEVALLLIRGADTREVAQRLAMTPYTVQDHLKSVFTKTGVSRRQELTALIMLALNSPG